MQLVLVAVAGAVLAWVYLAAFDTLLCGRRARAMSLLLAIVWFIEGTTILLLCIWVLSGGGFERLVAALIGFAIARVLLDRHAERTGGRVRSGSPEPLGRQPLDRLA